jgi:hypothetical protein
MPALPGKTEGACFVLRDLPLCPLGLVAQGLQRLAVQVRLGNAGGVSDPLHEGADQQVDEVLSAQEIVAAARLDLHDSLEQLEHRYVEGAAAQVENQEPALEVASVQAVGERGGGRLVDQPLDGEPGELAGDLGRLALGVVEVSGYGDHRLRYLLAEPGLGVGLERAQHQGGQLLGAERPFAEADLPVAAHLALEGGCGQLGMGQQALAGGPADQDLAAVVEPDHRWRQRLAQRVGHDSGLAVLPDRRQTVGRAEIDADNHTHGPECDRAPASV